MQDPVGENDEAAVLRTGVAACLLLPDQRLLLLGLGLQHQERKSPDVQKEVIYEPPAGLLEVVAQPVEVGGLDIDALLKADVGGPGRFREEAPTGPLQQPVNL